MVHDVTDHGHDLRCRPVSPAAAGGIYTRTRQATYCQPRTSSELASVKVALRPRKMRRDRAFLLHSILAEPKWVPVETPFAVCGNGVLETGEECDDGKRKDGDGCSSTCQVRNISLL